MIINLIIEYTKCIFIIILEFCITIYIYIYIYIKILYEILIPNKIRVMNIIKYIFIKKI